jgi:heme oxygenase
MYLALLSGGQIIRKIQKNAMGLPNDKGGEIFEFEQVSAARRGNVS